MLALIIIAGIYSGFSILTFIMFIMQSYLLTKKIIIQYPDIAKEYSKKYKSNVLEKIFRWTKLFVTCFVPIFNIVLFYVVMFCTDTLEEKILNRIKRDIES